MSEQVVLSVTYDRESDVLYIHMVNEPADRAFEDESGILWRYGATGTLIGATVVGLAEIWADKPRSLVILLAERLSMPMAEAADLVARAFS